MVSFLGRLGSKVVALPLACFRSWLASAEVMAELVVRTYSRIAVREGDGRGTVGQRAFCMVVGFGEEKY